MRASDILGRDVVDADGIEVGHVHDMRVVRDKAGAPGNAGSLRLDGLVIGRGAITSRLGYGRSGVKGPWLLRAIAAKLGRRAKYVEWSHVVERDDVLRLDVRVTDLGPPPPLPALDAEEDS